MQTMSIWKALFTPSVPHSSCDLQDAPEALWKQMLEAVQVRVPPSPRAPDSSLFEELRFSSSDFNGCYDD